MKRSAVLAAAIAAIAVAPATASATITITSQGGEIHPEVFATTDGSDGGGTMFDLKTIPSLPGPGTASVSAGPPPAAASSSIGSAHASASSTLSVSSTVSQTTGMVFTSTMSASDAASTHRDTADSQAARRLGASASEEGGSSMQFTIDVPMDYTLSGGLTNSVNAANPDSSESIRLGGPTGTVEQAQTGQAVGGSGLLPAGHYSLVSSAFLNVGAGEPSAQGGSLSASGTVGFDVTLTLTPAVDSDGDGLPNSWETSGLDTDGDGTVDVDLPAMGADPNHKDIFLEIDAMAGHELGDAAVDDVVQAFDSAPVSNPDGSTGIALHVDNGPDSVMDPTTGAPWGAQSRRDVLTHQQVLGTETSGEYNWGAFDVIKAAHFDPDRRPVFHYVVAAHQFGGAAQKSSGISRGIGASDLIVTLGFCVAALTSDCPSSERVQAGTLMHELGHNLGLHHGGTDELNHKPVYLSIMNYDFQFSWLPKVDGTDVLDYSRFDLAADENALNETAGFGVPASSPAAAFDTIFTCAGNKHLVALTASVNFNCNAIDDGTVATDINDDGALTALTGNQDWPRLSYKNGGIGSLGAPALAQTTPEIEPAVTELEADAAIVAAGVGTPPGLPIQPTPLSPPTAPSPVPSPAAPTTRVKCTIKPRSTVIALRGALRGRLTLSARCNVAATLRVSGRVTVKSPARHGARRRTTTVAIASSSRRVTANTTLAIKIALPASVLRALAQHRSTSASLQARATAAAGTSTATATIARLKGRH